MKMDSLSYQRFKKKKKL